MTINVTIPLEKLQETAVSEALAALMLALGNHQSVAAAQAAPAPANGRSSRRRRRAKAPSVPEPASAGSSDPERLRAFIESLPNPSRRFLNVLEERGRLTISQAMKALEVDRPKAMGGITGSITRWARERGLVVPFETAKTKKGERLWRWTGPKKGTD